MIHPRGLEGRSLSINVEEFPIALLFFSATFGDFVVRFAVELQKTILLIYARVETDILTKH
jgi:hypothetical protein